MTHQKYINTLVLLVIILSAFVCIAGLTFDGGSGPYEITSIRGESVTLDGRGLYRYDSISVAAQARAQDLITLIMGVPLLVGALVFSNKGSFRARLLLTGTLGYFLYTYTSYTFLSNYNPVFLIYVLLMSASLAAFVLSLLSFELNKVPLFFKNKLPTVLFGVFQLFIALVITLLWLSKIAPTIFGSDVPAGLEHYTTLVIQGMDLGFVVPAAVLSGVLIIKRKPAGYLLTSVIILKAITMLTSLSAMIIGQALADVTMPLVEIIIFPAFNVMTILLLIVLMVNIKKGPQSA